MDYPVRIAREVITNSFELVLVKSVLRYSYAWTLLLLLLFQSLLQAQTNHVQGGIFNPSANVLSVRAKASETIGQPNILSNIVVTIRWPSSYGVSLGPVSSPTYRITKQGAEGQSGIYAYQKFAAANNTPLDWTAGIDVELFTVTVNQSGSGTGTFELTNAVPGGEWYVEISGADRSNPTFYQGSTQNVPLGSSQPIAAAIAAISGNNQVAIAGAQLADSLAVIVRDQLGDPFAGREVRFSIGTAPPGASGQILRDTLVYSNSAGLASTRLTLGTKSGPYSVLATTVGLAGSPVSFTASAVAGPPVAFTIASGNAQIGPPSTALPLPLTVLVSDEFANPVAGVSISFNITSTPTGATGHKLEPLVTATDSLGRASSLFTLGNVAGSYTVSAAAGTGGLIGGPVIFVATASSGGSGPATTLVMSYGNQQIAPVLTELPTPIVVTVLNDAGIPVESIAVRFVIDSIPSGATGHRLKDTLRTTDAVGQAMTYLTLGNKTGIYRIRVSSDGLSGSPLYFRARGVAGPASALEYVAGNNQRKTIRSVIDTALTVRVTDLGGNPVDTATIAFVFAQVPSGATGHLLSKTSIKTDSLGIASARVTLGNKAGSYVVSASLEGLTGSPVLFTMQALDSISTSVLAEAIPAEFKLTQNYPNPFNPSTTIEFEVPRGDRGRIDLSIDIYNQLGEKVKSLVSGEYEAGYYKVVWHGVDDGGTRVSSGVYYYHMVSREYRSSKKMILLR